MNNYEKIKNMTVDELAEWLENYSKNIILNICNDIIKKLLDSENRSRVVTEIKKRLLLSEVEND